MSIRGDARRITDLGDGSLHHPNLLDVWNNSKARVDEWSYVVDVITSTLREVQKLSLRIDGEAAKLGLEE